MKRTWFQRCMAAAAATAALAGLAIPAGGRQLEPLRFISFGAPRAVTQGLDLGLFEREGIALETARTQNSEQQLQELLDLQWGIASTNADNVVYWIEDRGADFIIFIVGRGAVTQNFYVRPEIRSFEDIRGKMLAVDSAHSGFATVLRKILMENGLVIGRDYRFLPVGDTGLRTRALLEERAVGAMLGEASEAAVTAGIYPLARGADYAPVYPSGGFLTTRRWAAQNEGLLLGFLRALIATQEWLLDPNHAEEAVTSIMRTDRVNEARARQIYNRAREEIGGLDVERQVQTEAMQFVIDMRADVGLLHGITPPPSKYVDPSWYQRALESRR